MHVVRPSVAAFARDVRDDIHDARFRYLTDQLGLDGRT
jgi:hypothetical protein